MTATYTERERARKRRYRARKPDSQERPFVGIDGEGGDVDGRHRYFLLRAGDKYIESDTGLGTLDCLEFISSLPPDRIYVGYYFDYDNTKILEEIGYTKAYRLLHRETRMPTQFRRAAPFPVTINRMYDVDYLPGKELRVRKLGGPWVTISDVGSFFQCPFIQALEEWDIGTPEERSLIAKEKLRRNKFQVRDLPEIREYNALEIRLLVELMNKFRDACKRSGYVPRKWQGPGQIAEAMLSARGVPRSREVPLLSDPRTKELLEFASNAFYGGRPETTRVGPVPGPVTQWDINSAYPFALLHVPCLLHGKWRKITGHKHSPRKNGEIHEDDYALCYGHFRDPNKSRTRYMPRLYGLPIRRDTGTIYYPAEGRGWYWAFEINAAVHQEFSCEESYAYTRQCDCQPFAFIHDVYAMRLRLGKDSLGRVLKLALNSLYGKMAQSIGNPKYANPIWASFITAYCRTMVQWLIHMHPSHRQGKCGDEVIMVATDAIFTTAELPLESSKKLGGYSKELHPEGMFLIQPGLYFGSNGKRAKTRGVPRNVVEEHEDDFRRAFREMNESRDINKGEVQLPITTFIGLRLAVHRQNMHIAGQWLRFKENDEKPGKTISFDWSSKRAAGFSHPFSPGAEVRTLPYWGGPKVHTVPYSKDIGGILEELRMPFEGQPDWATVLMAVEE